MIFVLDEDSQDYDSETKHVLMMLRSFAREYVFTKRKASILICGNKDFNLGLYVKYKITERGCMFQFSCLLVTGEEKVHFLDELNVWESVIFTPESYQKIKSIVQSFVHVRFLRMPII
jgi:hypothetical protein